MDPDFVLRPATAEDRELLLGWRNDEGVRTTSRTQHEIGAEEHGAWLGRVLADPSRTLLIAEVDGRPVGQVRFDATGEGEWEITVSVDTAARGRGLGTRLIEAGVGWLADRGSEERGSVQRGVVVAAVRNDNERSRRAFLAAGFEAAGAGEPGFERLVRRFG